MEKRREELTNLKTYIKGVDNQLTMILEALQWDRKQLLQSPALVPCKYDTNHKVPPDKIQEHENECFLRQNGYSKDDQLLPDPLDLESKTLVKLKKEEIEQIIAKASISDTLFKKGVGCREAEPLSLERLQVSYSADERRAIHDAVVSAVPSCHDLTDLALLSGGNDQNAKVILSRQQILLELRNMRRRRAKYRVATKSRNYSDVLRDVIRTQMEHYVDGKTETDTKETVEKDNKPKDTFDDRKYFRSASKDDRFKYDGKIVPKPIKIKTEREDFTETKYRDNNQRDYSRNRSQIKTEAEDSTERKNRDYNQGDYSRNRSDRPYDYETSSKNRRDRDNDKRERNDRSTDRRNYDDLESIQKYGEHSRKRKYDNEARERQNYFGESEDRRQGNETDKEYSSGKRSRKSHRYKDYDYEYQVNIDLDGLDDETKHRHGETSKESRREESRDKAHKHKEKKDRRRDRESSKERRRDKRYEERGRSGEKKHFKYEREGSVTRYETDAYDNYKDKSRKRKDNRHDGSYRDDKNYAGHSLNIKQEKCDSDYVPSEVTYDPHIKIKVEQ